MYVLMPVWPQTHDLTALAWSQTQDLIALAFQVLGFAGMYCQALWDPNLVFFFSI